jgi:hypothetical protein
LFAGQQDPDTSDRSLRGDDDMVGKDEKSVVIPAQAGILNSLFHYKVTALRGAVKDCKTDVKCTA